MMTFALAMDPAVISTLGWTLIHFLWQGALLALLLSAALRWTQSAENRYCAAVATLVAMSAAPFLTFGYLRHSPVTPAASLGSAAKGWLTAAASPVNLIERGAAPSHATPLSTWISPELIAALWLVGVFLLSLRAAGGWWMLRRLRRQCREAVPEPILSLCLELRQRMGIARRVRFCLSTAIDAPAVLGWFRPIVLLPLASISGLSVEQLEAVIAHELAHIQRLDAFVNALQVTIETLLFYHPAVWWVSRVIRTEREHCCDDVAVSVRGDALDYARALALMEESRLLPDFALAVNSRPLRDRVARLLGVQAPARPLPVAVVLMFCLATGGAVLLAARPALSETLTVIEERISAGSDNTTSGKTVATTHRPLVKPSPLGTSQELPSLQVARALEAETNLLATREADHSLETDAQDHDSKEQGSYIDEMTAAGYRDLTVDQLIELKTQGVSGKYVRELADAGLHPDLEQLIELRVQGVTGQYVHDIRALGLNPDVKHLIELKVQGVNADYLMRMNAIGLHPDIQHLVEMKVQGVSPEYVQELKAAGIDVDIEHLIEMRVQGVSAAYVREIRAAGWNPTANQLVEMKIQGVGPADAAEFKKIGFTGLSVDKLVEAKIQGVTPAYVAGMRAAGIHSDSMDDYIEARIQGVTPRFVEKARQHGFKDLTLEKLIRLRTADVL